MKLTIGLGNMGGEYRYTRHNVGYRVVDALAMEIQSLRSHPTGSQIRTQEKELEFRYDKKLQSLVLTLLQPATHNPQLILAKPATFMNISGIAVKKLITHYKVNAKNLWVIHDDLDIRLGEYKIQFGKGPREHRGLLSIYEKLGTKDFWHVRIGVDNRGSDNRTPGEKYVLQKFTEEELAFLKEVSLEVTKELLNRLAI
jgi:PTH1 family peptidyl-tRNA hydrolase